jgi:hypothetical protein
LRHCEDSLSAEYQQKRSTWLPSIIQLSVMPHRCTTIEYLPFAIPPATRHAEHMGNAVVLQEPDDDIRTIFKVGGLNHRDPMWEATSNTAGSGNSLFEMYF